MNDSSERSEQLSPLKRALVALDRMQARLEAVEQAKHEPIAIIGLGCRFPGGAVDPERFWTLLREGREGTVEVPADRWDIDRYYHPDPSAPGRVYTRYGGFLGAIDGFDARFFGISPRELASMDPQQRLLLEVSWEALEHAGVVPETLAGTQTGVFMGVMAADYARLLVHDDDLSRIDAYYATGNEPSFIAGRISYVLGLHGPSIALDTACSSSLVAIHLACQSLRAGESDLALAGGVNLILTPELSVFLCKARVMSTDGRCRTFDADAGGIGRGEGCGVVVLKRLSDAIAAGDRVLALIRGSAVNHDGPSGGLTVPSGPAQQALIRRALVAARVKPAQIDYVEAHGTGTPLGDPIEVGALAAVLTEDRPADRPLTIGSVKTNFGHTEAAAGVAGLIKVVLSLQHGEIPPHLHFKRPNPHIPWDRMALRVPTERLPWPSGDRRRLAGVSSFGLSGINAHLVVEEAPPPRGPSQLPTAQSSTAPDPAFSGLSSSPSPQWGGGQEVGSAIATAPFLLPLSARSEAALLELASRYTALLDGVGRAYPLADICHGAARHRSHHDHRLAVVGDSHDTMLEQLSAFRRGEPAPGLRTGPPRPEPRPQVVFVFPGQGSQWPGMGRGLLERAPAFRAELERLDAILKLEAGWSLLEALRDDDPTALASRIDVIQPALFALEVALAAQWRAWGLEPDVVVGHSMGEVAAACVAGALSLEDGARVICRRSRLLRRVSGQGAMAVVELSREDAASAIAGYEDHLSIAVSNSPRSTVLSGDPGALDQVLAALEARDVFCRRVKVDIASHSPQMDPLRPDLLSLLAGLRPRAGEVPILSTVSGEVVDGAAFDAAYWAKNLRRPVLFWDAVRQLTERGSALFAELSPHPILLPAIDEGLRTVGRAGAAVPSMRREEPELEVMLQSLGALYAGGASIDWAKLYPEGRRDVPLPTYPWQRERYWIDGPDMIEGPNADASSSPMLSAVSASERTTAPAARPAPGSRARRAEHAALRILGERLEVATQPGAHFWTMPLDLKAFPFLADHRVQGSIVLPGAAYLEMALAAAKEAFGDGPHTLEKIELSQMLPVGDAARTVQLVLTKDTSGTATFQVLSREPVASGEAPWVCHASGRLVVAAEDAPATRETELLASPKEIQARCPTQIGGLEHYQSLADRGLEYGPAFRGVAELWRRDGEALARIEPTAAVTSSVHAYQVHPALLDAALQVIAAAAGDDGDTCVPVGIETFRQYGLPGTDLWSHAVLRSEGGDTFSGDLVVMDGAGRIVLEALGLRLQRLRQPTRDPLDELLYRIDWTLEAARPPVAGPYVTPGSWLILADGGPVSDGLIARLEAIGERCVRVMAGTTFACEGASSYRIVPTDPEQYPRIIRDVIASGRPPLRGAVHLWGVESERELERIEPVGFAGSATCEAPLAAQDWGSIAALHLVQALTRAGLRDMPRLWLVSRGAQAVMTEADGGAGYAPVDPTHAPLWGLARTLAHEHPDLRATCIDLDPAGLPTGRSTDASLTPTNRPAGAAEVDALLDVVRDDGLEDQIAFRNGRRYLARLTRSSWAAGWEDTTTRPAGSRSFKLELGAPGVLDRLRLRETLRRPPGPGEVEIEVTAAGLNFLDVLLAMGVLPDDARDGSGAGFGAECAGRIVAIGEGVAGLEPGQEVLAVALGAFGRFVTTSLHLVVPRPPSLTPVEAASIPIVFLTAWYALHRVARLEPGERILIHAAAGGVGLAALQLAKRIGAEIFATAGSPEKRAYLESIGVTHVMDSRSLSFYEDVMKATRGEGVDVVLNSLAGEFIPRSFGLLRDHGRFIELGKRDYYADRQLGLKPFLRNLSFSLVDLRAMVLRRPERIGALWREVMPLFETQVLTPLPTRIFHISQVIDAFHYMAQARHIGKVVLSLDHVDQVPIRRPAPSASHPHGRARGGAMDARDPRVTAFAPGAPEGTTSSPAASGPREHHPSIRPDRTWLLTGGLGGLGLEVARWLVANGARHLALMGRNAPGEAALDAIAAMERLGAVVRVVRADVARRDEVAAVFTELDRSMPPLHGVMHAAAVLDDGTIARLTREQFQRVMAPKLAGAWHLHQLTLDRPLEHFVLFSSASALLGSPGQANYVAANAFLDALAWHRRALGLPAVSIDWGAWSDVGLAAAQANRGERLAYRGVGSMTPAQGVEALSRLLEHAPPQVGVMAFNLRQWSEFYLTAGQSPFLSQLAQEQRIGAEAPTSNRMRESLAAAEPAARRGQLEQHLREQLGQVLRLPSARIGVSTPFSSLGLDSLMALELRNRLEASLDLTLTTTLVWTYPTVAALAPFLASRMEIPLEAPAPSEPAPSADGVAGPPKASGPPAPPLSDPAETPAAGRIADALAALKKLSSADLETLLTDKPGARP